MSVSKFVPLAAAAAFSFMQLTSARAADLYAGYRDQRTLISGQTWQGGYLGGNLGGAWGSSEPAGNIVFLGANPGSVLANRSIDSFGATGGLQGGYNFQTGNFVFGIEGDIGAMGIGGSKAFSDASTPGRVLQVKGSSGWYGDITGRAGFVYDRALIYAKGGLALYTGGVSIDDNFDDIHQNSGTFTGWTIGGGVEYMLAPNWTFKVEYLHFDFDNTNFNCCFGFASSGKLEDKLTVDMVKIGFNFLLPGSNRPLY